MKYEWNKNWLFRKVKKKHSEEWIWTIGLRVMSPTGSPDYPTSLPIRDTIIRRWNINIFLSTVTATLLLWDNFRRTQKKECWYGDSNPSSRRERPAWLATTLYQHLMLRNKIQLINIYSYRFCEDQYRTSKSKTQTFFKYQMRNQQ